MKFSKWLHGSIYVVQTKLAATTQETYVGVGGVSQQILTQWQEEARKTNKSDP